MLDQEMRAKSVLQADLQGNHDRMRADLEEQHRLEANQLHDTVPRHSKSNPAFGLPAMETKSRSFGCR
jgi:hypothetical protein